MSPIVRFCLLRWTAFKRLGIAIAAKIPMIAITIRSSISVNPFSRWVIKKGPDFSGPFSVTYRCRTKTDLVLGPFGPLNERAVGVDDVRVEVGRRPAGTAVGGLVAAERNDVVVVPRPIDIVVEAVGPAVQERNLRDVRRRQVRERRGIELETNGRVETAAGRGGILVVVDRV